MSSTNIMRVSKYLAEVGVFFLSTTDGDKPKCRPIGAQYLIDDKLYFVVGSQKDVYKQIEKNPNVEIVASKEHDWLRYYGTAVFEETYDLAELILSNAPFLKGIYNDETGFKMMVFHLENATAEFRSMTAVVESYKF